VKRSFWRALRRFAFQPRWANGGPALILASFFIVGSVGLLALAIIERGDGLGLAAASVACGGVAVAAGRMWWRRFNEASHSE
jgi:hypothetical protein